MPTTSSGITYLELVGDYDSPEETYDVTKVAAKQRFRVAWNDRTQFIHDMLGGFTVTPGPPPVFTYSAPSAYPPLPILFAKRAHARPLGKPTGIGPDGVAQYDGYAAVEIDFETPDPKDPEDPDGDGTTPFLSENIRFNGQMVKLPGSSARFPATANIYDDFGDEIMIAGAPAEIPADYRCEENPGKLMPVMEYQLTIHRFPSPLWNVMSNLVSTVNGAVFSPLGRFTFSVGTLLFTGPSGRRETVVDPQGRIIVQAWTIDYRFLFRRIPWNFWFHPFNRVGDVDVAAGWVKMVDGSGRFIYPETDFTPLLFGVGGTGSAQAFAREADNRARNRQISAFTKR